MKRKSHTNAPVKFFCPHPPPQDTPVDITFFVVAPGFVSPQFLLAPPYNIYIITKITLFLECPALFYHTHIFSDPGAAQGWMRAEQFDWRIKEIPFLTLICSLFLGPIFYKKDDFLIEA